MKTENFKKNIKKKITKIILLRALFICSTLAVTLFIVSEKSPAKITLLVIALFVWTCSLGFLSIETLIRNEMLKRGYYD